LENKKKNALEIHVLRETATGCFLRVGDKNMHFSLKWGKYEFWSSGSITKFIGS
jgi:hypothetical protein